MTIIKTPKKSPKIEGISLEEANQDIEAVSAEIEDNSFKTIPKIEKKYVSPNSLENFKSTEVNVHFISNANSNQVKLFVYKDEELYLGRINDIETFAISRDKKINLQKIILNFED